MTISIQPAAGTPLGFLGLGLLSRNLILTMARQGFPVVGYDSDPGRVEQLRTQAEGLPVTACSDLGDFTGQLQSPRAILILVQGGPQLEATCRDLVTHLDAGDLMIDGTSYHHVLTPRRRTFFADFGVHFLAAGIASSGHCHQYGCRPLYPELQETCRRIRPLFEIVATAAAGEPCVSFVGRQIARQLMRLEQAAPLLPFPERGECEMMPKEVQREGHRPDRRDSLRQEYCGANSW